MFREVRRCSKPYSQVVIVDDNGTIHYNIPVMNKKVAFKVVSETGRTWGVV